MKSEHWKDRLIDGLLREVAGKETPPDLSGRIVAEAFPGCKSRKVKFRWAAALAAVVIIAVGVFAAWPRYPTMRVQGDYEIAGGGRLARGAVLATKEGAAELELGGYATLRMEPETALRIEGQPHAEAVHLQRGEVLCNVEHDRGAFEVKTDVGTVSAIGTEFTVRILEEQGGTEMSAKRMLVKVMAGAVLIAGSWGQRTVYADGEVVVPDAAYVIEETAEPNSGTVVGILTAKGKNWVEVKEDGKKESQRYIAEWKGGLPKDGGGPDAAMVETIKKLIVPNRVKLDWKLDEHLRVLKIEMLIPEKKEGVVEGIVTAKGKNWAEVTPEGGVPNRYWPRWIGGMPKDGGGFDGDMVRIMATIVRVNQKVRIEWTYDERLRAVTLDILESPEPTVGEALPEGLRGFSGQVRGVVVAKGDNNTFTFKVAQVLRVWKNNQAENPEALVGLTVSVGPRWVKGNNGQWHPVERQVAFIRQLKAGQELTLELRNAEASHFNILELSAEQIGLVAGQGETRDKPAERKAEAEIRELRAEVQRLRAQVAELERLKAEMAELRRLLEEKKD